jgi:putative NADPH-quinone reductase
MKVSVILAHPQKGSFNHAIALTAADQLRRNGHEVRFHDLYEEKFDPILNGTEIPKNADLPESIADHCREIAEAEGIVIVHPNWWGQPPAILKGWIDRVIRPGIAYEFLDNDTGEGIPNGLLEARVAVVFNTSNTETEREKNIFGDPLETIWKNCIFALCGIGNVYRQMYTIIVTSTEEQRKIWLDEVRQSVDKLFPPYLSPR